MILKDSQVRTGESHRLNALTSLRFVAATLIVIHHLRGSMGVSVTVLDPMALDNGVSFFFVLSGFVLAYAYGAVPRLDWRRFLLARWARLWPAHVAALIVMLLLTPRDVKGGFSLSRLLANLSLVHAWVPVRSYNFSFVGPSWSISTEFAFYLCFIFLIRNWARTGWLKVLLAFGMLVITVLEVPSLARTFGVSTVDLDVSLVYVHPVARLFEFTLGMLTADVWRRAAGRIRYGTGLGTGVEALAVALVGYLMLRAGDFAAAAHPFIGQSGTTWLVHGGLSCGGFALLIFVMALERGLLSRLLMCRLPVLLGDISYSVYLMHFTLINWANANHRALAAVPDTSVRFGFVLALLSLSYLVWVLIERPSRRFLVGLGGRVRIDDRRSSGLDHLTRGGERGCETTLEGVRKPGVWLAALVLAVVSASAGYRVSRPLVEFVSPAMADEILKGSPEDFRDIQFGDRLVLLGVRFRPMKDEIRLDLVWKSAKGGSLDLLTPVHLIDSGGRITWQGDFEQDPQRKWVPAGSRWRNEVRIPRVEAGRSRAVAFGLLHGDQWLFADRGPSDWGGRRVVLPLPDRGAAAAIEEAKRMTPPALIDYAGRDFDGRFSLLGLDIGCTTEGLAVQLAWESSSDQALLWTNAIHLIDEHGEILGQADYKQASDGRRAKAGETWVDRFSIPSGKLTDRMQSVALALYDGPTTLLTSGDHTDWGGRRLVIPIPRCK